MSEQLVSIAMCTYNGAKYLKPQLDSILRQTYANLELVVFDDCSTDETWSILEEYAQRDHRIRIFYNDRNVGFVKNFENAIAECRGELIALADQDDVWLEQKITALVEDIGDNLLIYSRVSLIGPNGEGLDEEFPGKSVRRLDGDCALALVLGNCVTGHACLIRRELFEKARQSLSAMRYHDQWLAIVAAAEGRLKAGNEVLSYYRLHNNNVVFKNKKKRKEHKYLAVMNKLNGQLAFLRAVSQANVLNSHQRALLDELCELLAQNERSFFNFKLRRFLRRHKSTFLRVFSNEEKVIGRMCRGKWYFFFIPFA